MRPARCDRGAMHDDYGGDDDGNDDGDHNVVDAHGIDEFGAQYREGVYELKRNNTDSKMFIPYQLY